MPDALALYRTGDADVFAAVDEAHRLAGRYPLCGLLPFIAQRQGQSEGRPRQFAPVIVAEAAVVIARAGGAAVDHALCAELPAALDRIDTLTRSQHSTLFSATKGVLIRRATTQLVFPPAELPVERVDMAAEQVRWLSDPHLHHLLGAAVYSALQHAELLMEDGWTLLPQALDQVGQVVCELGELDPAWSTFIEVQCASRLARAAGIPADTSILHPQIPALLGAVGQEPRLGQLDLLSIALADFQYAPDGANQSMVDVVRARVAQAATSPSDADVAGARAQSPTATGRAAAALAAPSAARAAGAAYDITIIAPDPAESPGRPRGRR